MAGHAVSRDRTETEHGETRYGWWCDPCELGGFANSEAEREEEVREHVGR